MDDEVISISSSSEVLPKALSLSPSTILNRFSITLKQSDIERLSPERFLNDNVIDFFLNLYIHSRPNFYAFNSFFYSNLTDRGFATVQSWTRSIDLFSKAFWLIPVAQNDHWVLIIITHPQNAFTGRRPQPKILFCDSLDMKMFNPRRNLERYMRNEWVARGNPDMDIDVPIHWLRLPLQDNSWDCGVFLLYYAEKFIGQPERFENAEMDFSDMFSTEDMENKRDILRNIIQQMKNGTALAKINPHSVTLEMSVIQIKDDEDSEIVMQEKQENCKEIIENINEPVQVRIPLRKHSRFS
jgi:Ulp1 family protease